MTFRDVKEYIRFEEIFKNLIKASAEVRGKMEESALLIVNALERIENERIPAQREQDKWQGLLVAEEMNGKTNPKTAEAAEAAILKVVKLEQSFKALSRTGGLAVIHLEKRKIDIEIKLMGLHNERKATEMVDSYNISAPDRKARLKKLDAEIPKAVEELSELDKTLSILKQSQGKNGILIIVDANTQAAADSALQLAIDGYIEILKMKEALIGKIESKQDQLEKMKEELSALQEAQNSLNPEIIADQFSGSEIEAVFLPEEYREATTWGEKQHLRTQFMSYVRGKIRESMSK